MTRPSILLCLKDDLAALNFDLAVMSIGSAIENYAQEKENTGSKEDPNWVNKYLLQDLLDPDYRVEVEDPFPSHEEFRTIEGITYDEVK